MESIEYISFLRYFIASTLNNFDSPNKNPEKKDWIILKRTLPQFLKAFRDKNERIFVIKDKSWIVMVGKLFGEVFHEKKVSYSLIASCAYHKNEYKNIYSKLDGACNNLERHSSFENEKIKNGLLIRLPETVSIEKCLNWVKEYFINFPDKPLSTVILYQPSLVGNLKENSNSIHHCFKSERKKTLERDDLKLLEITIPIGIIDHNPSKIQVIAGENIISVDNRYIVQKGNHYLKATRKEDGSIVGNIKMIAPGINQHAIFSEPFKGEMLISGIFPPNSKLHII